MSLFSTIQCFLVAIVMERDMAKWRLHWDDGLLADVYTVSVPLYFSFMSSIYCTRMNV